MEDVVVLKLTEIFKGKKKKNPKVSYHWSSEASPGKLSDGGRTFSKLFKHTRSFCLHFISEPQQTDPDV